MAFAHYKGTRGEHKETRGPDRMNTIRSRDRHMNFTELVTVILQTYKFVKIVIIFFMANTDLQHICEGLCPQPEDEEDEGMEGWKIFILCTCEAISIAHISPFFCPQIISTFFIWLSEFGLKIRIILLQYHNSYATAL